MTPAIHSFYPNTQAPTPVFGRRWSKPHLKNEDVLMAYAETGDPYAQVGYAQKLIEVTWPQWRIGLIKALPFGKFRTVPEPIKEAMTWLWIARESTRPGSNVPLPPVPPDKKKEWPKERNRIYTEAETLLHELMDVLPQQTVNDSWAKAIAWINPRRDAYYKPVKDMLAKEKAKAARIAAANAKKTSPNTAKFSGSFNIKEGSVLATHQAASGMPQYARELATQHLQQIRETAADYQDDIKTKLPNQDNGTPTDPVHFNLHFYSQKVLNNNALIAGDNVDIQVFKDQAQVDTYTLTRHVPESIPEFFARVMEEAKLLSQQLYPWWEPKK